MNASITNSRLKELVKEVMVEENEYQAFFAKALEKAGKGINDMSEEEKKAFFNKVDSAWNGKGEKNESVNEGISVFDERFFGKKGIIIMIDDNGKKVSAIFKDKKNADKYNRNNPSDIKKLLDLAKKTKYPNAIDESVNEALSVDPRKVYGGTGAKEGMVLVAQKGLEKILDLSKKNPSNVFLVSDDNYTKFGPYYVKNGKVAKYTVANPNYDLEKNKVRTLKVPSDVILKFRIMEGVKESVNERYTGNSGDKLKHKYDKNIEIELIEPTNKGWKVYQTDKGNKRKIAYFDKQDIVGNKSLFESVNEDVSAELPKAIIPSAVKQKLELAIDKIKDAKLNPTQKLQLVAQVVDSLGIDKTQLGTIANKIRSKMESKK